MRTCLPILSILLLTGPSASAFAGQKSVEDIPAQAAEIAQAITQQCHAAAGEDAKAALACQDSQRAALEAILDNLSDSDETYALLDCTEQQQTWQEVDWAWAWNCMQ